MSMKVTYDPTVDASSIYLTDISVGGVKDSLILPFDMMIILHFDAIASESARLVKIEVLDVTGYLLPALLSERRFRVLYDPTTDVARISLSPDAVLPVFRRVEYHDEPFSLRLALCLDSSDRLIGVEIQDAGHRLPEDVLQQAEVEGGHTEH
jgi:uncharacterized protein YuzE